MANYEKGEVDLPVGDKLYTVQLTWNEIAKFEAIQDVGWFEDFVPKLSAPNSIRGGEWIALLWAGLHSHHTELTLLDAGNIMTKVGAEKVVEVVMKCLQFTFPDPPKVDENPPKAGPRNGTGKKRS